MAKDDKGHALDAFNMHKDDQRGWHYHVTPGKFPYIIGGFAGAGRPAEPAARAAGIEVREKGIGAYRKRFGLSTRAARWRSLSPRRTMHVHGKSQSTVQRAGQR